MLLKEPEYRLISRHGQDRSANSKECARTTDKGNQNGWIYSLISRYNEMKRELTQMDELPCRLDVLYGWKTLYPFFACRIWG